MPTVLQQSIWSSPVLNEPTLKVSKRHDFALWYVLKMTSCVFFLQESTTEAFAFISGKTFTWWCFHLAHLNEAITSKWGMKAEILVRKGSSLSTKFLCPWWGLQLFSNSTVRCSWKTYDIFCQVSYGFVRLELKDSLNIYIRDETITIDIVPEPYTFFLPSPKQFMCNQSFFQFVKK